MVGVKLEPDLVETARQQAEADGRTLSNYLRRIITAAVEPKVPEADEERVDRG